MNQELHSNRIAGTTRLTIRGEGRNTKTRAGCRPSGSSQQRRLFQDPPRYGSAQPPVKEQSPLRRNANNLRRCSMPQPPAND